MSGRCFVLLIVLLAQFPLRAESPQELTTLLQRLDVENFDQRFKSTRELLKFVPAHYDTIEAAAQKMSADSQRVIFDALREWYKKPDNALAAIDHAASFESLLKEASSRLQDNVCDDWTARAIALLMTRAMTGDAGAKKLLLATR